MLLSETSQQPGRLEARLLDVTRRGGTVGDDDGTEALQDDTAAAREEEDRVGCKRT